MIYNLVSENFQVFSQHLKLYMICCILRLKIERRVCILRILQAMNTSNSLLLRSPGLQTAFLPLAVFSLVFLISPLPGSFAVYTVKFFTLQTALCFMCTTYLFHFC